MKHLIFSIYDRKAGLFGNPFYANNTAVALRSFKIMTVNGDKLLAEDCELYQLGCFDVASGLIESFDKPVYVANYFDTLEGVSE